MKKVLIVDDDKYFTDDLGEYFELRDIPYTIANTADEFEKKLHNLSEFGTVVLDVMMRKGSQQKLSNGRETGEILFAELRSINPTIGVVVLSAKDKSDVNIDFEKPHTDYISKPVGSNIQQLVELIESNQ